MIFLSYRRADTGGHASNLHHRLRLWFDDDALFYDQATIDMGAVFPDAIAEAIGNAAVVLVLIGPDWLDEINRRVGQPGIDYVRREIALALASGKPLIPVFVGGALPFALDALHAEVRAELAGLDTRNAHNFLGNAADWDNQFVRLRDKLASFPGMPKPLFRPPAEAARPCHRIGHRLSPHFRDPNELLPQLHAQLTEQGRTALVAHTALYGMGGIGKTQLALKYSLDYADRYAGVWWFRAETEDGLQLDAQECCQRVGAHIEHGERPSAALKRWLERQTAAWLLVYDNAEHADSLRPHLPQGRTHRIIVTSRDPNWRGLLPQALELEIWSPEQGAAFLAARLPGQAEADLRALSADLGGLPLALEQAGAYIESTGVSVAAYRKLLAAIDTEGMILDEGRAATGYERSVLATLTLACDKLGTAATEAVRLLAYAAPEAFAERFLREAASELPAALAEAVANDLRWNRVVAELRAYGLVTRPMLTAWAEGAGEEAALSLHRLTQQALRAHFAEPARDSAVLQSVLSAACPQDAQLPANWPRYAALLPHITHLDRYLDIGGLDRRRHSWLFDRSASYLHFGPALYTEAVDWFRRALDINRADLGEEHPDTLTIMNNLAEALRAQGDLVGALDLQKSALAIQRRILGDEHPNTLISMGNLANTLKAQGNLTGAFELEKSALVLRRSILGDEHPHTLTAMGNLAATLYAQGDLAGALDLHKSVLALRRRILGEEHPDTLTTMNNLAEALRAQGDLVSALDLLRSALAIQRRILGEEHPNTLRSMNNLALTLKAQGDFAGALALQKSALALRRRILGEEHPATLISMNNLASTLRFHGDLAGALDLEKSALAIRRRILGDEHLHTLTAMNNLAETLRTQGDFADALDLHKSALAIRHRILGEMHPDTLQSMNNLAETLYAHGDLIGALDIHKSVLAILRRVLGETHPNTLVTAWNLFTTALELNDAATATEVFQTLLQPLLHANPASLPASSKFIRDQLLAMINPAQPTP